jgi:hypothetical protein
MGPILGGGHTMHALIEQHREAIADICRRFDDAVDHPKSGSWMIASLCRIVGTIGDELTVASAFASPCG